MKSHRLSIAPLLAAAVLAAGCATLQRPTSPEDPFEPWNRAMFAIHEPINDNILRPIAEAYVEHVPYLIRHPIANFFANIEDMFSALNGALQNKPDKAGHDLGRVIINTAFGLGGLIDIASDAGIPRGNEDFGQTFGVWGFPQGPYLFVPIWGPSTVRDGTGSLVRIYANPIGHIEDVPTRNILEAAQAGDLYVQSLDAQKLVEQASLDKYAFIRRSYLQRRRYLTYDGKPPPEKDDQ